MTAEVAAIVAAVLALSGTIAAAVVQTRANRRATFVGDLRRRTGDAFAQAFVVQHAIEWVTWYANNDPDALDNRMKGEYAQEVHRAFPAFLGAMAATAALSMDVYHGLQPVIRDLYAVEVRVALAMRDVDTQGEPRTAAIGQLIELHEEALRLLEVLPHRLSEVMTLADKAGR